MIRFDLNRLYPKFILQDKNGYAIAKALEAGLKYFLDRCQEGLDCVLDPDKMPEWRLDEMAWELNSLYDYTADVASKRKWIKDAIPLYSIWGTPQSVVDYLSGYFDAVELEEFWQYGGDPYHFRVTLTGEWTAENEAWARRAINTAKNVRSVMDTLAAGAGAFIEVRAEQDAYWRFPYPMTGTLEAGTWQQENTIGIIDAGGADVGAAAEDYKFPYTMAGTVPDTATIGVLAGGGAVLDGQAEGYPFDYRMPGDNVRTGEHPQPAILAAFSDGAAEADTSDAAYSIPYKLCGYDEL
ncbi:MAG: phage tail protein [Succinivibrionaceae bacterium]|nr:phage tail protein [Succinivibrionaceae bacterium]